MNESPSSNLKYIIYKTTNQINGKSYIGKHQTRNLDDGYQGSGKYLKLAIKKYGQENFVTKTLEVYDQEWKMNLAERILVITDPELSYNLCSGGKGGFGYINSHPDKKNWVTKGYQQANLKKYVHKNGNKSALKLFEEKRGIFSKEYKDKVRRFKSCEIEEIKTLYEYLSFGQIAKMFGVAKTSIYRIVIGERYKDV